MLCILGDGVQRHFQQYFSHILAISFIGGGNRRKRRPAESHWLILSHNVVSNTPHYERDSNSQLKWWWALIPQVRQLRQRRSTFPCMEYGGLVASISYGLTSNPMYRVGIIISEINDVESQWKSCFQSLGLWSFIIVFYGISRFLHSATIEECYFSLKR